jgi:alanine racemase
MPRPIQAVIDLAALRHNLAQLRARAGRRRVWAVVKADAYGHGLARVLPALDAADGLALLDLQEAELARSLGWRKPILLLEGVFEPADVEVVERLRLTTVVHHLDQVALLEKHRARQTVHVYIKFNSGMNRLGFAGSAGREAIALLQSMPQVRIESLMTHFANADRADPREGPAALLDQLERFEAMAAGWDGPRSLANSAALLTQPRVGGDSVRPGIALYGAAAVSGVPPSVFGLQPVMSLRSTVLSVQALAPGESVGYGSRWVARRPSRIAVVAGGYADGYPRLAPDGTPVTVAGHLAPLAGQVSMDMITVDVTDLPAVAPGAAVELWGQTVAIDAVAEAAGTVGYELMCALAPRVPVAVHDGAGAAAD